ncbi:MAG: TrpR-like protein [candidate division WWE3 bacterium CSP1-7]|uniref:TrpR-like protein n=1 Tax=candidate division WWE3 bacterium CSP1-7 TaxID=1576480 RepID=A0A0T5ZY85_UNCKA|nr:MAG: TrpR-like protein [candidate division WWE3 bacterium CSP1-7]
MPRVSPRPLKKEIEKEITANLDWTFSQLKSEPVAKDFLEDFLTDEERLMLAKRLAVVYLLKEGFSYGKISEALKITPVTIGKIRLILRLVKPRTLDVLNRMGNRFSLKSVGKDFLEALKDLGIFRKQGSRRVFPKSH